MKLTKGRINKVMRCRQQTAKALHDKSESRKRSASDFTRKSGKNGKGRSSVLNKTMYRTRHLETKEEHELKEETKPN
jgi:hypothetical protein